MCARKKVNTKRNLRKRRQQRVRVDDGGLFKVEGVSVEVMALFSSPSPILFLGYCPLPFLSFILLSPRWEMNSLLAPPGPPHTHPLHSKYQRCAGRAGVTHSSRC